MTLANELSQRLPAEFVATLPGGISGAFAAIPLIERLAEPLKTEVQIAFAQSIRTIWFVLIPFVSGDFLLFYATKKNPDPVLTPLFFPFAGCFWVDSYVVYENVQAWDCDGRNVGNEGEESRC